MQLAEALVAVDPDVSDEKLSTTAVNRVVDALRTLEL